MSLIQEVFPNYGKIKQNDNTEEDTLKEYRKQLKEIIKTNSNMEEQTNVVATPAIAVSEEPQINNDLLLQLINESILLRKDLLRSQSNLESLVYILMLLIIILTVSVIKLLVIKN